MTDCLDGKQSRLMQPPSSLELRGQIVVQPQDALNNAVESMNSIGTCSLDIDYTNYNRKNYAYCSISEKSVGSLNKYDSSELGNSNCLTVNGHRLPSYVGISCAISGYSSYSRFCASTRNSHSHGNSPTCRYFDSDESSSKFKIDDDCRSRDSLKSSQDKTGPLESLTRRDSQEEADSGSKEKSLVQQKIESLYGKTFANGWRDSRLRHRISKCDADLVQRRSPSCPPKMVQQEQVDNVKSDSRPVFRHVTKAFLEQLELKGSSERRESGKQEVKMSAELISNGTNGASEEEAGAARSTSRSSSSSVKDGNWFMAELSRSCEDIKKMVDEVSVYIESESSKLSEEVMGKLLSFVGKANLLLSQKLKQFRELTLKNINQKVGEEYPTTNEDLEGFWEMVLIQIKEINNIFDEILKLKTNNWEITREIKKVNQPKMRSLRKNASTTTKANLVKSDISAAREEARRSRLREAMKLQATKFLREADNKPDVSIFIPSSNDALIPRESNSHLMKEDEEEEEKKRRNEERMKEEKRGEDGD